MVFQFGARLDFLFCSPFVQVRSVEIGPTFLSSFRPTFAGWSSHPFRNNPYLNDHYSVTYTASASQPRPSGKTEREKKKTKNLKHNTLRNSLLKQGYGDVRKEEEEEEEEGDLTDGDEGKTLHEQSCQRQACPRCESRRAECRTCR